MFVEGVRKTDTSGRSDRLSVGLTHMREPNDVVYIRPGTPGDNWQ